MQVCTMLHEEVGYLELVLYIWQTETHTSLCQRLLNYRIYSRNLRTFFSSLAAEKSGCVKYADFFVKNTVSFINILL
jgi:hypothetical protein